jgi:transcriptional regulator with PAS, ATPase and Fis domain
VRELRNVVERSLLLKGPGATVEFRDLPALHALAGPERSVEMPSGPLADAVRGYERGMIVAALERSGGVVARAAELLGISRTNLHNKLAKHGLLKSQAWGDSSHQA